jgi:predicted phage terminase large subunit-like protein
MEGCYNTGLSRRSSKIVRDRILEKQDSERVVFRDVFPKVTIKEGSGSVDNWGVTGSQEDNYLATAPNAGSTGIGCDFLILDDTIKNKYEAYNKEILRKIYEDWFRDTLYQRLEGKRKIIVVMTRWSTNDLAGCLIRLFEEQGRKYKIISKKAYDDKTDKMLNPTILNKKQYDLLIQTIGEDIVRANYDQEPIDLKGKLYKRFLTYNPADIKTVDNRDGKIVFRDIRAFADTADKGQDYLAMVIYGVTADKKAYILDIYYTQDDMETTEKEAAKRLFKYNPYVFRPESNNGGEGWSRAVRREYQKLGGTKTIFRTYTQTRNKEARILSESTFVQDNIYFPMDWNVRYRDAYNSMNEYQRQGKNEHDDIEDCITSIAEDLDVNSGVKFG